MTISTASELPPPAWLNINVLKSMGFNYIIQMGGRCPFQMELGHKSGIYLYFRARHNTVCIDVYNVDPESVGYALPDDEFLIDWSAAQYWPNFTEDAGYIEPNEALYILHSLWSDLKDFILE